MFKRITAVSMTPLLIILFMLLMRHLQPLGWARLANPDWMRTGRLLLDTLPYGLAFMGLGIGWRFRSCGVMIAMLSLATAYRILRHLAAGASDPQALAWGIVFLAPVLLAPNFLLAAWTERVGWRTPRGLGAMVATVLWCLAGLGDALAGGHRTLALTRLLATRAGGVTDALSAYLAVVPGLPAGSDRLDLAVDGAMLVWPACLVLGGLAVYRRSAILAGLAGGLAVTAPPVVRAVGLDSLGLVYAAAASIVLVGLLEAVFKRAYRDGLTDLPARRSLDDTLRMLGRRYAIAMLDVDHFKRFNDRYGHATGDQVLKMIAARARRIRGGQPFRYGGEEFAVVFTGRCAARAAEALEDFRRQLALTPFVVRKMPRPGRNRQGRATRNRVRSTRRKVRVTVSIGLAVGDRKRSAPDVLKAADKALYTAKRKGRNRLCRAA